MSKKKIRRQPRQPSSEIALIGELFEEGEGEIVRALLELEPGAEATLYIDCAGGSVYAALAIVSLIRLRRIKAVGIVIGECSSSALLVFAACQRRLVTPRSIFLFHKVRWRSDKEVRSEEATAWAEHFLWLEKELDRYQAELFGLSTNRFVTWINESRFVTGKDLVDLGLAEMVDV